MGVCAPSFCSRNHRAYPFMYIPLWYYTVPLLCSYTDPFMFTSFPLYVYSISPHVQDNVQLLRMTFLPICRRRHPFVASALFSREKNRLEKAPETFICEMDIIFTSKGTEFKVDSTNEFIRWSQGFKSGISVSFLGKRRSEDVDCTHGHILRSKG